MSFFKRFYYAGRGLLNALTERNFRFHICAAADVVFFGAEFYSFDKAEWAALLLTCAGVLSLECVNTALERLCDKVCSEKDELIKKCKDISAGAVLISAIFAVAIGVILFWDAGKFAEIADFFSKPPRLILLMIGVLLEAAFVFLPKQKDNNIDKIDKK